MHVGQPEIAASAAVGQLGVVEAEQVQGGAWRWLLLNLPLHGTGDVDAVQFGSGLVAQAFADDV